MKPTNCRTKVSSFGRILVHGWDGRPSPAQLAETPLSRHLLPSRYSAPAARPAAEPQFSLILTALIARLSTDGILFTHCHDGRWRPPDTPRNVTSEWWLAHGGILWDGESRPTPEGRVARRFTSTG